MPRRELDQLQLAPRHLAMLRELVACHAPRAEAWAFGSRVRGGAHEGSDLDLVLRNVDDPTQAVGGVAALREALQQSLLPMLVDVHDWSTLPEAFRCNILADYVVLSSPRAG